jgi:hypothetical protein
MTTYEYVFYEIDESFEFCGCWGNEICYQWSSHGFEISDDINCDYAISTIRGFGHYSEMSNIKSLQELRDYLEAHLDEVQEIKDYTKDKNILRFKNLIKFIDTQIEEELKNDENTIKEIFLKRSISEHSGIAM